MSFSDRVITLISNPSNPCLTPQIADRVRDATGASGVYFLADGIACDLPIPDTSQKPEQWVAEALAGESIDWVVQYADNRRKKALIADMDSTMIEQECLDELAAQAGVGERVAEITARAMRGEIEFEGALRERVSLLKGHDVQLIDQVIESKITLMPGGRELVSTMKQNGAFCALVSGGFTQFTSVIAQKLGFDANRANTFEIDNGCFTGNVVPPILGKQAKVDALDDLCQRLSLETSVFMAVGDGANDLGMLLKAGTGVALHAKPVVSEQAEFRIDHGDLTALLYMQGYRKTDFAEV